MTAEEKLAIALEALRRLDAWANEKDSFKYPRNELENAYRLVRQTLARFDMSSPGEDMGIRDQAGLDYWKARLGEKLARIEQTPGAPETPNDCRVDPIHYGLGQKCARGTHGCKHSHEDDGALSPQHSRGCIEQPHGIAAAADAFLETRKRIEQTSGDWMPGRGPVRKSLYPDQPSGAAVLRCERTGNPCGTDTWRINHPCTCAKCQQWIREVNPLIADPSLRFPQAEQTSGAAAGPQRALGINTSRPADGADEPGTTSRVLDFLHESTDDERSLIRQMMLADGEEAAIRADEREACAKVCDDIASDGRRSGTLLWERAAEKCAVLIRTRGAK